MNILEEAMELTRADRRKDYGDAKQSFGTIARLWSTVLGFPVTPQQVVLCMIQLKVARQMAGYKRDSLVDIAGYARCGEMLEDTDTRQETEREAWQQRQEAGSEESHHD